MKNSQAIEYVTCPFCKEFDFDLIGLKHHFEAAYCMPYENTPRIGANNENQS